MIKNNKSSQSSGVQVLCLEASLDHAAAAAWHLVRRVSGDRPTRPWRMRRVVTVQCICAAALVQFSARMPGFTAQSRSAAGCGLVVNLARLHAISLLAVRLISRVTHDAAGLLAVAIGDHTASTLYTARCGQLLLVSCAAWSVCLAHEAKNGDRAR